MAPFSNAWDEAKPAGTDAIALGDDQIRKFKLDARERLNVEHDFPSATGNLRHKFGYGTTAQRDAITDWVVGSIWFNTDAITGFIVAQVVSAVGPVVWQNVASHIITGARGRAFAGDAITAPAAFADMPNMSVTQTTNGKPVLINVQVTLNPTGAADGATIRLMIDGVEKCGASAQSAGALQKASVSLTWLELALSAASHIFKVQWERIGTGCQTPVLTVNRSITVVEETQVAT